MFIGSTAHPDPKSKPEELSWRGKVRPCWFRQMQIWEQIVCPRVGDKSPGPFSLFKRFALKNGPRLLSPTLGHR